MTKAIKKVYDGFINTAAIALAKGDKDNAALALTMAARYMDVEARQSGKKSDAAIARALWEQVASL